MTEYIHPEITRREVLVRGVVQGVGFRPFVYRLAQELALSGWIGNDTDGVRIEIEGTAEQLDAFLMRLQSDAPTLARINGIAQRELKPMKSTTFQILSSQVVGNVNTSIPADAATCADCLRELLDPADRRYRYPFLNCTNCGPRFTITRRIPYDRPQTSMAKFPMCAACQSEYDDPTNRRFHAQPNACPVCGPKLWLECANSANFADNDPITQTIHLLLDGEIVAIKGIGGFHLSVDAANEQTVMRLRERKQRYEKPLAVMVRDLAAARSLCMLTPEEEALLQSTARPIVLVRQRANSGIANAIAPGVPWLGIFLPYAPLQHLLFADERIRALVMTSANLSDEPIAIENEEARRRLSKIADAFLLHNREILVRADDSVAAVIDGVPQLIRRARGYVPLGIALPNTVPILAVGGHLKNTFTLARDGFAYPSQHLGDWESPATQAFFEESLDHWLRVFEMQPVAVAHDLHPGYPSTARATAYAEKRGLPLIAVQHHHAHIAGCMAENKLIGPVIGLALDGTGYGSDETIWGGEVLISRLHDFEHFAHLEYLPMPGATAAIQEPWRMTFSALRNAGFEVETSAQLCGATNQEARVLERMMERKLNAPMTSSCGRLFDAAAALILGRRIVAYEAQAAMELEGIAIDEADDMGYQMTLEDGSLDSRVPLILRAKPLWQALIADLRSGASKATMAARFHAGVADGFVKAVQAARSATGIEQVALSGGCFHNRRLARLLRVAFEADGFKVYQHFQLSPGDGGLSYGQAVVAAARLRDAKSFAKMH